MAHELPRIAVDPDSEIAQLIRVAHAAKGPVLIHIGEATYRLQIEDVEHRAPDDGTVAASVEGIRRAAGSWQDVDAEAFKE